MWYKYSITDFFFTILVPIFVMIGLLTWSVVGVVTTGTIPLFNLIIVVVPILLLSTFIGVHNPSAIQISDDVIKFRTFGITHTYRWGEITTLELKKYSYIGMLYVRCNTAKRIKIFGGRYWITNKMRNYIELKELLYNKATLISEKEHSQEDQLAEGGEYQ